jgi:hypothetical protein
VTPTETEDEEPPKKKSKVTPKKSSSKKPTPKKTISKDESDEEPWETFVPKEGTPDAGDRPYTPNTIHPNTLQFLKGTTIHCKPT